MRNFVLFCALVVVVLLASVEASATTAQQISREEQVATADAICIGRCTHIETRLVGDNIYTYITLDVREVMKGQITPGTLVIKQVGGAVGSRGEWIYGSPRFDVGRDSLVFLASNGSGAYVVDGLFMGNYFIEQGLDGREWVRRDQGDGAVVLPNAAVAPGDTFELLPLEDLRSYVVSTVARSRARQQALAAQIPEEYTRPFEGESEVTPSFVLMNNTRWFEPDTDTPIQFMVNPENFQGTTGQDQLLVDAVKDALAAWSTIDGCKLKLEYGGVDTFRCGWAPADSVTQVSIDCHNEVASTGCRSIIAIGGGHWTRGTTIEVNGVTFYKIVEADVTLNDGFCDLYANSVALREILTHELGHCIGLAHSQDSNANMAPFVHNDGRGATLTEDDKEGARFIYPGPTSGGGGGDGGGGGGTTDPEPPVIATTNLEDGVVGVLYTKVFLVTNGKEPFEWSIANGDLPAGLSLSTGGLLAGVPTESGTTTFAVRVTDSLGRVDGAFLTLKVRVPAPIVASAVYKSGKKTLTIVGLNFAADAQFEVNGIPTTPPKPPVYSEATNTFTLKGSRKKLHLNKSVGTNQLVVIVEGERSQVYTF